MELPTALESAPLLPGREVFVKREDVHELGAFKWRGALPVVAQYRESGAAGVVTASTGNHGAATAWACRRLGLRAIVFAPVDSSRSKLAKIEALGAELRVSGRDFDEAKEEGREEARELLLPFFEDGAEPAQYEGYGAIAEEIFAQSPRAPAAIFVPVGNGALIAGIGRVVKRRSPQTLVIGAAAREAPVMALSFDFGEPVHCARMATFADGLAVRVAIPRAVEAMRGAVDRMELVSEREIAQAIGAFAAAGIRVEGAAAAALAALRRHGEVAGPAVLVVTGRNIDEDLYQRAVLDPDSF
ncbi:MAG: threonine/serine dehydratase [Thermoanaerobaculia bacterium]